MVSDIGVANIHAMEHKSDLRSRLWWQATQKYLGGESHCVKAPYSYTKQFSHKIEFHSNE